MRRTRRSILAGMAASVPAAAWAARRAHVPGSPPPVVAPTIVSVTPATGGFTGGTGSANATIATMVATMSPASPGFTGTWSLSGADAASFAINSSTGVLKVGAGDVADGVYNINAIATQVGATGSPFTQPIVITGAAGFLLSTLTLVNTSGSTQAADFISPMFGWVFKKGEIPSGTAPIFKNGSTPQPYSWGLQTYWSDDSLKFASFMLRSTASIAGSGSLSIGVWSGGTAPSASARTLTEVYSEELKVSVVGYGSSLGLSGTWSAWLDNDATDTNNAEQFVYLDGDAGKVWRFLTHMAATQRGTPHGQLECWHYVAALTATGGGLGGFRYLPCVAQPWYNVDSPAKAIRSMTTVQWQHGSGPTVVPLALQMTAMNFTHVAGTTGSCVSVNGSGTPTVSDYYSGAIDNVYHIPCYLTTTGTLPTNLAVDTLYYCHGTKNSTTVTFTTSPNGGASARSITGTGTGTHTINPVATLEHFDRLFMPTVNGTWNFFQGAGSFTADHTVRTKIDIDYWHGDSANKLSLLPPHDLALKGIVTDPPFTYNWVPYGIGNLTLNRGGGGGSGGRPDLGAIMAWQSIDYLRQSANSEKTIRVDAFAGVHDLICVRNNTNHNVVNIRGAAHTGLTQFTTIHWYPDTNSAGSAPGFTRPPDANVTAIFDQGSNAHKPAFFYYAYLRTGEPQFLDCMVEMAIQGTQQINVTARNTTGTNPGVYTGIGSLWGGSGHERQVAWGHRDLQQAASVCPLVMPDSSDLFACLNGIATDSLSAMLDLAASTAIMGSYAVTNKMWLFYDPVSAFFVNPGFSRRYMHVAIAFAAGAREDANAITWLQNEADWHAYVVANFGYYCTTSYFDHQTLNFDATLIGGKPAISTDAMYATTTPWTCAYNGANNPAWTFTRASSVNGAVLQDGDKFLFNKGAGQGSTQGLPANYNNDTAYYAINTAGNSCNLTTVAGNAGNIVVPTGSGTVGAAQNAGNSWYVPVTDVAPAVGAENTGYSGAGSYMSGKRAAHLWMTALGVTGLSAAITDAGLRSGCTGTNAGFIADPTNAYQDHFGA